jgi:hypothetical protein
MRANDAKEEGVRYQEHRATSFQLPAPSSQLNLLMPNSILLLYRRAFLRKSATSSFANQQFTLTPLLVLAGGWELVAGSLSSLATALSLTPDT